MEAEVNKKIDKIFSIVSNIQTDVAVIKNNDTHTQGKLKEIDKKVFVMDVDIQNLQFLETKIGAATRIVIYLVGSAGAVTGGIAVIVINHFWK